jgi:AcrR family transcriptional regulator
MAQVNAGRPARPMRADARRNYERLLKEATAAFAEHGEGASLDDIAKRAGVGSGTLYRHFPTRQALLEAVYVDSIEAIAARADEIAAVRAPGEALAEWMVALGEQMVQVRGLKALLVTAVEDGSTAVLAECGGALKSAAGRLVEAAQREGTVRPDIRATDVLRLAHGVASAAESGTAEPELIRRYLGLIMEGLRVDGR